MTSLMAYSKKKCFMWELFGNLSLVLSSINVDYLKPWLNHLGKVSPRVNEPIEGVNL